MEKALQISFKGVDHSDAVQDAIKSRMEKIENHHNFITGCKVVVERPHKHQNKGNIYRIGIEIDIPNDVIAINHEKTEHANHEDIYIALRDAFDIADRQLRKVSNRKKQQERTISFAKNAPQPITDDTSQ